MKILVVSHMYPSSQNPSYGIFIHKQVMALKNRGCEVKVVSPVPYAPWPLPVLKKKWKMYASIPQKNVVDGVEVYYPRYPEFPRSYLLEHSGYFMFRGLRNLVERIYREFKFDLIHAHVALPDGHAAALLKKVYRVPVIVTVHGQDFQSTIRRGQKCRAKVFEVLSAADKVITVSSKLKNMVKDQPFVTKISVVNNGIDLKDCKPADPGNSLTESGEQVGPSHPEVRMISVSNLKKTKGIDLNIQALSSLAGKYPGLIYTIVGEGEERQNLENLVDRLNLRNHVRFLGRLFHPETMKQMAKADIFCLPSWQEGFGVVYIEAMALGLPVIGVQGEGIEDVIRPGDNGLMVRPQNVDDIVQAIDTLLSEPLYAKRLAEAGRKTVQEGYTWEQNAEKTIDLYKEVLEF